MIKRASKHVRTDKHSLISESMKENITEWYENTMDIRDPTNNSGSSMHILKPAPAQLRNILDPAIISDILKGLKELDHVRWSYDK